MTEESAACACSALQPLEEPDSRWVAALSGSDIEYTQAEPQHITDVLGSPGEDDPVVDPYDQLDDTLNSDPDDQDDQLPTAIFGGPALQHRIRDILTRHRTIFRARVSPTPTAVPHLKIVVNEDAWNTGTVNTGYRHRPASRDAEID